MLIMLGCWLLSTRSCAVEVLGFLGLRFVLVVFMGLSWVVMGVGGSVVGALSIVESGGGRETMRR